MGQSVSTASRRHSAASDHSRGPPPWPRATPPPLPHASAAVQLACQLHVQRHAGGSPAAVRSVCQDAPWGLGGGGAVKCGGRVLPMGPATEAHTQLQGPLKHAGPHAPLERGFYTTHTRSAAYVLPGDPSQPPTHKRPYTHARMHVRPPSSPPRICCCSAAGCLPWSHTQTACVGPRGTRLQERDPSPTGGAAGVQEQQLPQLLCLGSPVKPPHSSAQCQMEVQSEPGGTQVGG